ncbi:MAG TPA: hypothetical protein VK668_22555 [Mucilaginibacter sp.]|nr:hypothetical protein [Mucilaginibacter sp.]
MKHFYKALFITLFLPLFSLAQSNYKPGYVISLKGDTTHGYIDYRGWESNPNSINFKKTITDSKVQKLGTDDISYFSIGDLATYQKYSGRISMNPTDPSHVINGRDSSFKIGTVFLKLLQKGDKIILFEYTDDIKPRFYIAEKPGDTPYELEYKIYTNSESSSTAGKTVSENVYMRQLYNLAIKDNVLTDKLQVDIERTEYSSTGILELVTKINGKSATENSKHTKPNFFAGVALQVTHTVPTSALGEAGAQPYTSYLPAVSFGIDFPLTANSGRLILRLELSVAQSKYSSNYDNKFSPKVNVTYSYNALAFAGSPQLIYNFYYSDNFKFFGGLGVNLTGYSHSNVKYKDKDGNNVQTGADPYHSFASESIPFLIKAGVKINKKYGIYASYLSNSPVSDDYVFRLNFSSIQFGVNYFFGK